jgi:hypothetical protein
VTVDPVGTTRMLLPMPMSDGSPEYFPPPPGAPGSVIVADAWGVIGRARA